MSGIAPVEPQAGRFELVAELRRRPTPSLTDRVGPRLRESARLFRAAGDQRGVAEAFRALRVTELVHGPMPRARTWLQSSLAVARQSGDRAQIAWALLFLVGVDQFDAHAPPTEGYLEESRALFEEVGAFLGLTRVT
jgi:hypothetical protein